MKMQSCVRTHCVNDSVPEEYFSIQEFSYAFVLGQMHLYASQKCAYPSSIDQRIYPRIIP